MNPVLVASVVEGHGEVESVPILLRRVAVEWDPTVGIKTFAPVRTPRSKLLKPGELERAVKLASLKADGCGVLVLVDADDNCPAHIGPQLLARARTVIDDVAVVIAKSEFETWFVAAAESIAGQRGLRPDLTVPQHVEQRRDAKGWLTDHMAGDDQSYSETLDQPALTTTFDMASARASSDSFDKLYRELLGLFATLRKK